jgi:hypothetical protein
MLLMDFDQNTSYSYVYDPVTQSIYNWSCQAAQLNARGSTLFPATSVGQTLSWINTYGKGLLELRPTTYQDYIASANRDITFEVYSGHVDQGTLRKKKSKEIRLRLKRGVSSGAATMSLSLLDDNKQSWGPFSIDLGTTGNTELFVTLPAMGMYRTRQYQLSSTANVPIIIVDAEEDIELL